MKSSVEEKYFWLHVIKFYFLVFVTTLVGTTHAADLPDAGTSLRDITPATQPPAASRELNLQAPAVRQGASGGTEITLQTISFIGNPIH